MRCTTVLAAVAAMAGVATAAHGDSYEGTVMGPVAFLWPDDRVWDSADDNIGPCGSSDGPSNRTTFPLDAGHVALSVADEAYKVAFYISFDNNPTAQSAFDEQIVNNITELAPGHQCYLIDDIPATVGAGDNATIQLQYWAVYEGENNNKNETFYACADITFVEADDFDTSVPCFNVTASTFDSDTTTTAAVSTATATSDSSSSSSSSSSSESTSGSTSSKSSGLSTGAKAGIAVGSVIGGIAIGAVAVLLYLRRRRTGYLSRRRQSKINAPIPMNKPSGSFTSA